MHAGFVSDDGGRNQLGRHGCGRSLASHVACHSLVERRVVGGEGEVIEVAGFEFQSGRECPVIGGVLRVVFIGDAAAVEFPGRAVAVVVGDDPAVEGVGSIKVLRIGHTLIEAQLQGVRGFGLAALPLVVGHDVVGVSSLDVRGDEVGAGLVCARVDSYAVGLARHGKGKLRGIDVAAVRAARAGRPVDIDVAASVVGAGQCGGHDAGLSRRVFANPALNGVGCAQCRALRDDHRHRVQAGSCHAHGLRHGVACFGRAAGSRRAVNHDVVA